MGRVFCCALRRLALLCRARAELSRIFARIIQARRESQATEEDILQCFIDSRYEKVAHAHPVCQNELVSDLRRMQCLRYMH